jgi:hypothetical protein
MWQVDASIPEITHPMERVRLFLNADKALHPSTFIPPINWTGFLDGNEVEIVQNNISAFSVRDFSFGTFPAKYNHLKGDVVALIDDCLRTMD